MRTKNEINEKRNSEVRSTKIGFGTNHKKDIIASVFVIILQTFWLEIKHSSIVPQ